MENWTVTLKADASIKNVSCYPYKYILNENAKIWLAVYTCSAIPAFVSRLIFTKLYIVELYTPPKSYWFLSTLILYFNRIFL